MPEPNQDFSPFALGGGDDSPLGGLLADLLRQWDELEAQNQATTSTQRAAVTPPPPQTSAAQAQQQTAAALYSLATATTPTQPSFADEDPIAMFATGVPAMQNAAAGTSSPTIAEPLPPAHDDWAPRPAPSQGKSSLPPQATPPARKPFQFDWNVPDSPEARVPEAKTPATEKPPFFGESTPAAAQPAKTAPPRDPKSESSFAWPHSGEETRAKASIDWTSPVAEPEQAAKPVPKDVFEWSLPAAEPISVAKAAEPLPTASKPESAAAEPPAAAPAKLAIDWSESAAAPVSVAKAAEALPPAIVEPPPAQTAATGAKDTFEWPAPVSVVHAAEPPAAATPRPAPKDAFEWAAPAAEPEPVAKAAEPPSAAPAAKPTADDAFEWLAPKAAEPPPAAPVAPAAKPTPSDTFEWPAPASVAKAAELPSVTPAPPAADTTPLSEAVDFFAWAAPVESEEAWTRAAVSAPADASEPEQQAEPVAEPAVETEPENEIRWTAPVEPVAVPETLPAFDTVAEILPEDAVEPVEAVADAEPVEAAPAAIESKSAFEWTAAVESVAAGHDLPVEESAAHADSKFGVDWTTPAEPAAEAENLPSAGTTTVEPEAAVETLPVIEVAEVADIAPADTPASIEAVAEIQPEHFFEWTAPVEPADAVSEPETSLELAGPQVQLAAGAAEGIEPESALEWAEPAEPADAIDTVDAVEATPLVETAAHVEPEVRPVSMELPALGSALLGMAAPEAIPDPEPGEFFEWLNPAPQTARREAEAEAAPAPAVSQPASALKYSDAVFLEEDEGGLLFESFYDPAAKQTAFRLEDDARPAKIAEAVTETVAPVAETVAPVAETVALVEDVEADEALEAVAETVAPVAETAAPVEELEAESETETDLEAVPVIAEQASAGAEQAPLAEEPAAERAVSALQALADLMEAELESSSVELAPTAEETQQALTEESKHDLVRKLYAAAAETGDLTLSRFVVFRIGNNQFALPIDSVVETERLPSITPVPGLPEFVRGIFNLRGEILTLVDLRNLMGIHLTDGHDGGNMIVVRTKRSVEQVAFVVDSVPGLAALKTAELAAAPSLLDERVRPMVVGIGEYKDRLVSVLDPDRIFAHSELQELTAQI